MNDSTWGSAPDPDPRTGPGPYDRYDPWPGAGPHGAQQRVDETGAAEGADALRTQVIPAVPGESHPAHAWAGPYGAAAEPRYGATHAQQHPDPAPGVDPHGGTLDTDLIGGGPGTPADGGHLAPGDATTLLPPLGIDEPADPEIAAPAAVASAKPEAPVSPEARRSRAGRNLPAAIGVALGLGAVIIGSLLILPELFVGVVIVAVLVGLWEFSGALGRATGADAGVRLPLVPLGVGGAGMLLAAYAGGPEGLVVATALTAVAVMVWRMTEGPEHYLRDMTAGVFTVFYLPFLASFALLLLAADDGPQRVLTFMIAVVCADTGAYASGVKFGRHKMAPTISPGKTWEGLAGAVIVAAVGGAVSMRLMLDAAWWQGAVVGAAAALLAAIGDLAESMIKRDIGVKDMGNLLPGHGGILDRLDSLLVTAPVVWLLLELFL